MKQQEWCWGEKRRLLPAGGAGEGTRAAPRALQVTHPSPLCPLQPAQGPATTSPMTVACPLPSCWAERRGTLVVVPPRAGVAFTGSSVLRCRLGSCQRARCLRCSGRGRACSPQPSVPRGAAGAWPTPCRSQPWAAVPCSRSFVLGQQTGIGELPAAAFSLRAPAARCSWPELSRGRAAPCSLLRLACCLQQLNAAFCLFQCHQSWTLRCSFSPHIYLSTSPWCLLSPGPCRAVSHRPPRGSGAGIWHCRWS